MPGIWLGENTIPSLRETSQGVLEFGFYRTTSLRVRLLVFVPVFVFITVLCGIGLFLFSGNWYPFALLAGFYLVATLIFFSVLFHSSTFVVDTNSRRLCRNIFLLDWKIRKSTIQLMDGDEFTVYWFPDEHGTGAEHCVYVTRNGADRLFCKIHLDDAEPSNELANWVASLADALSIRNGGYASRSEYLKRMARLRW